jgi:diguanylate cyclase
LDHFKQIKDTLGHDVGDQLLIAVAERLRSCVRGDDLVARLGGDEFVVLVDGIASRELAVHLAERILTALRRPYQLGDHEVVATPSIGVAMSGQLGVGADVDALMRAADQAMYGAKAAVNGTYAVYDPAGSVIP